MNDQASRTPNPAAPRPDRMPPLPPDRLTEAQRKVAAAISAGPRGAVFGPFVPLLRSPGLAGPVQQVGEYLRFRSTLPGRLREFAILLTARQWTQQFEWHHHVRIAHEEGLPAAVTEAIAEGRRPDPMGEEEAAVYDFCDELYRTRTVSDPTYARAARHFGEGGVIDLVGLCGYYSLLGMIMNVARTPLPTGAAPLLPALP